MFKMETLRTFLCIFMLSSLCSLENNFSIRVFLTGEITDINNKEVVTLKCQSSKASIIPVVEFLVDNITVGVVRFIAGKCSYGYRECNDKICMCSKDGKDFTWILYLSNMSRTHIFGCEVRIFSETNAMVKATATLQFNGSDFLVQPTNFVKITYSDRNSGNDFSKGVFLTREITEINNKEVVKLKCQSSKAPIFHLVEFFVDKITVDMVRLAAGKCFYSKGECNDNICMCSKDGKDFTWIFYLSNMSRTHIFGCQARILLEKNEIVKATATLQFNGSDFLVHQSKHENVVINSVDMTNSHDNDSDLTVIAAVVSSIVVCLLAVVIVSLLTYYYNKKQNERNEAGRDEQLLQEAATFRQVQQTVLYHPVERSNSQKTQNSTSLEYNENSGCSICEKRTTKDYSCPTLERDFSQICHNDECVECKCVRQKYAKMYDSCLSKELDFESDQKYTIDTIVILGDNRLLVVDKENNCLMVIDKENWWHSIHELKSKLIGVTALYKNVIAAIFSNEERILYIEILQDKINYTEKEIELKTLGKPLNIAYNEDHFVVRIGLGLNGRFTILNSEGKTLHIIWNFNMRFGDFTENSVEVALSFRKSCIFISLFDKNAVYCVNLKGHTLWDTHVSCPKGILYVSNTAFFGEKNIILACQNPNFIYQIDSESGKLTLLIDDKDGITVTKCIGYEETETKCLLYTDTNIGKILEFSLTAKII